MELPETEIVCRQLRRELIGRTLVELDVRRSDYCVNRARIDLTGRTLRAVDRHGKLAVMRLGVRGSPEADSAAVVRFGMTCQPLLTIGNDDRLDHVHVRFMFNGEIALNLRDPRRFGGVEIRSASECDTWRAREMGPDPFELDAERFWNRLKGRKAPIKHALLNQKIVSGIGNIYSDEALFDSGIHPRTPAARLGAGRAACLHASLVSILARAIQAGGSTISDFVDVMGRKGRFQLEHRVYGKFGSACPKCGKPFRRIKEPSRSYTFCSTCQRKS